MNGAARLPVVVMSAVTLLFLLGMRGRHSDVPPQNDLLNATLWSSNSIEYKANALAVFQLARIRLDQALADPAWSALAQVGAGEKPTAVIADVDETLLDNSAYQAWLIRSGQSFSSRTFAVWVRDARAGAIPGAVEFANYAVTKGVTMFYVTNRDAPEETATRVNMEALGFPMGGGVDTFLMNGERPEWTSRKSTRRDLIAATHRVVLLLGDNYGDFSDDYGQPEAGRLASFERNLPHFGRDWLTLANPQYGSFETAPFLGDFSLPPHERRRQKIDAIPAWAGTD